jgi:hypothetical protein
MPTLSAPKINGLNEMQLTLLRLFNRPMSHEDISEIRDVLVEHLHQKLQKQVAQDIAQKGIARKDFDRLLKTSKRHKS